MKTHDLAKALMLLARILRNSHNMELQDWPPRGSKNPHSGSEINTADAATALNVLVGLSRYNKSEWRTLLDEWRLPVPVLTSDSVRDLVGRLLKYLDENPDEGKRIQRESTRKHSKTSPELTKILSYLLGDDDGDDEDGEQSKKKKRQS